MSKSHYNIRYNLKQTFEFIRFLQPYKFLDPGINVIKKSKKVAMHTRIPILTMVVEINETL